MNITTAYANELCKYLLRTTAPTRNSPLFVSLCTSTPVAGDTGLGGGNTGVEANYTSYARVSVTPSDSNFSSPSAGASHNSGAITFPTSTGGSNVITAVAIMDANTSGNLLFFAAISPTKTITSGDTLTLNANNLTFTFS